MIRQYLQYLDSHVVSYQMVLLCHILTHVQNSARNRICVGILIQLFAKRADQRNWVGGTDRLWKA